VVETFSGMTFVHVINATTVSSGFVSAITPSPRLEAITKIVEPDGAPTGCRRPTFFIGVPERQFTTIRDPVLPSISDAGVPGYPPNSETEF